VYDIMNALDDRLTTPNSAVVLAAVRVFLNMTLSMPYDHQQVLRLATSEREHKASSHVCSRSLAAALFLDRCGLCCLRLSLGGVLSVKGGADVNNDGPCEAAQTYFEKTGQNPGAPFHAGAGTH
jgi:hypothetical protein